MKSLSITTLFIVCLYCCFCQSPNPEKAGI